MEDVLFVVGLVAFFALCVAYIRACDAIIGPDPVESSTPATSGADERISVG